MKVFASPSILAEARETLTRQKLRRQFPHLTAERVELFLQAVGQLAELMHDFPSVFSLPRDPDDAMYVDVALAAQAPFLVTRDNDLLDLMKDEDFRTKFPGLTIIDPAAFLKHVRAQIASESHDG